MAQSSIEFEPASNYEDVNYSGLKPPSFGSLRGVRLLSFLTDHPLHQRHSPLASYEGCGASLIEARFSVFRPTPFQLLFFVIPNRFLW